MAESFDHEIITKAYKPYDGLSLSVVLKAGGTIEKHVVGSVVESLVADPSEPEDFCRLTEIFDIFYANLTDSCLRFFPEIRYTNGEKAVGNMDVTRHIRQLEAAGFTEEILDRAIALAGANRLAYQMLHQAVISRGLTPADAVRFLESGQWKNF